MAPNTSQSKAKPAPKKKKGTASAVRAPKRGSGVTKRGGKASGAGREGAKARPGSSSSAGVASVGAENNSTTSKTNNDESSDEEDPGPYCICRGPDNHKFMIACDRCEDWFHGECIGMDKHTGETLVLAYICPKCGADGKYRTRYKLMCGFEGCNNAARLYGADAEDGNGSKFCCDDHCQLWWEQLIASMPKEGTGRGKTAATAAGDQMTQETFMGLLMTPEKAGKGKGGDWIFGKEPFSIDDDFWTKAPREDVLTGEQIAILDASAASRRALSDEMLTCKGMLQMLETAVNRRDAAIAAGKGTKDMCGYDTRLDPVASFVQFGDHISSPSAEAITTVWQQDAAILPDGAALPAVGGPDTSSMCAKKRCKPHNSWGAILTKAVKRQMRELTAEIKKLAAEEEAMLRTSAVRYLRRQRENNSVERYDSASEDEDDDNDDGGEDEDAMDMA